VGFVSLKLERQIKK